MKTADVVLIFWCFASVLGLSYRSRPEYATREEEETCVTPYGLEGTCIEFVKCQLILGLLECATDEALDYAHQSICSAGKFHAPVCCPHKEAERVRTDLCQSTTDPDTATDIPPSPTSSD